MKINFKELAKTVVNAGKEHSPEISTGVGIAFMVAGAVFSVVATVKTMRKVADAKAEKLTEIAANAEEYEQLSDEDQQRYDDICRSPMPIKEVVPIVWKHWVAPVGFLTAGAGCIIFSDREQAKRIASVTSALACHVADAKDYKEAVKEVIGEEKEEEVERKQTERTARRRRESYDGDVIDTGTGDQWYEDYYTGALIIASPEYIESCVNELNSVINDKAAFAIKDDLAYKYDTSLVYVTLTEWCNILSLKIKTNFFTDSFGFDARDGLAHLAGSNGSTKMLANGRSCIVLRFYGGNTPNYISAD